MSKCKGGPTSEPTTGLRPVKLEEVKKDVKVNAAGQKKNNK